MSASGQDGGRFHALSRLELLPTELLEKVFLYSRNLSLPLASPVFIGQRLSTEAVYKQICLVAFSFPNATAAGWTYGGLWEVHLWSAGLQNAILRRKWFTLPLLEKVEKLALARAQHVQEGIERPPSGFHSVNGHPRLQFARGVQMPVRLLHAPWTEDKLALLGRLIEHGAEFDGAYDMEKAFADAVYARVAQVVERFVKGMVRYLQRAEEKKLGLELVRWPNIGKVEEAAALSNKVVDWWEGCRSSSGEQWRWALLREPTTEHGEAWLLGFLQRPVAVA